MISRRINALTLLMAAVCLADSSSPEVTGRAEKIFDIMDFDGTQQISLDELVIFVLTWSLSI
jgi:hypothetical protein